MLLKILFLLGILLLPLNGIRYKSFNISDWLFLFSLLLLLFEASIGKVKISRKAIFHPFWIPAIIVFLGGLLAAIVSNNSTASILITIRMVYLFTLWTALVVVVIKTKELTRPALHAYLLGIVLTSALTIFDSITGSSFAYQLASASDKINVTPLESIIFMGRYVGTLGHPNSFGQINAAALPIAFDMTVMSYRKHEKIRFCYFLTSTVVLIWGVYLSGSVAALIGALLGITVALLVFLASNPLKLWAFLTVILVLFVYGFTLLTGSLAVTSPLYQVQHNIDRVLDTTGPVRAAVITESINAISENPFTGLGMDQNPSDEDTALTSLRTDFTVHNSLILAWVGGGILTFIGIVLIYFTSLKLSLKALLANVRTVKHHYAIGLAASFIAWAFVDMTGPSMYTRYTWVTIAILMSLSLSKSYKHEMQKGFYR